MAEHKYTKEELIQRFDGILEKTFEEIDDIGMFEHVLHEDFKLQKGIAGSVIEQCVLRYPPDTKQEADLVVVDNGENVNTELKVTGMRISKDGGKAHFIAKEPMSITAVGVYELDQQTFCTSHFWNKLEHMLIVYYLYDSDKAVKPYDYKDFPVKGYEFHEFEETDKQTLANDWRRVHSLICDIIRDNPGTRDKEWKERVKQDYIERHGQLRSVLSYIDLAPKFPPRFRLKKPTVSTIIAKHFGYELEQLPGRYTSISDIEIKIMELTKQYRGKTIGELADFFGVPKRTKDGKENKGIAEQIIIKMFGGNSSKMNQIELFQRFGLIGKSITVTSSGGRTEDMKLFHVHFDDIQQTTITDDDGTTRLFSFEDSEMYSYFADNELLCIIFEEPSHEAPLVSNVFKGFKRLVFSDTFIDKYVRYVWEDTREKVLNGTLQDVIQKNKDGEVLKLKNGETSSAPNFMKGSQNIVFFRGSGTDSSLKYKTEIVNGIRMLPQYIWIKGTAIIKELNLSDIL
ncbi:MAG: restriction endonuclease [Ruminococcus albus]|nr:restriction endonuclease [Ruminococcus albus]